MIIINNLDDLNVFIELIQDLAFFKNMKGEYIYFNEAYLKFVKKNREEVLNKSVFDLYSTKEANKFNNDDEDVLKTNKNRVHEEIYTKENGEVIVIHISKQIIYDKNQNQLGLFCIAKDITLEKEYKTIYEDTKKILEYIAINDDLEKTLYKIITLAEERLNGSKCSILLLSKDKQHLINGSKNGLPDFFNDAINGLKIGKKIGSCGSAAFKQERVIIEDIDTHENWQPYLNLTKKANLHACWSELIFSSKHELLGTFAIYHNVKKYPSDFQLKFISSYAHLASVAIEKDYNEKIILEKEQKLLVESRKSSQLFKNALVGLMYISKERILLKANQSLANIFGYDNPQDMVGISMRDLHLSEERYILFGEKNFKPLIYGEQYNIEYQLRRKDGSSVWCSLSGKTLDTNYPADLSKGVLWTLLDISKKKQLESEVEKRANELEQMSIIDELTNLYNRKHYNNKLTELLDLYKRYHTIFSIIMYDIDDFKNINDTYGHHVGDKVLINMSKLVKSLLRKTDLLFRIGGEEFIILIVETDMDESTYIAEKIRKKVAKLKTIKDKKVTISLGLTEVNNSDNEDTIFQRVDRLLYYSKKNGKNMVSTKVIGDVSYSYYFDSDTKTLYERISGTYMNMNAFKDTLMNEEYIIRYLKCENIITDFTGLEMNFEHYKDEVMIMFSKYAQLYLKNRDKYLKNKKSASYIYKFDNVNFVKPFRELQDSVGVKTKNFKKIDDISKFIGFDTKKYFEMSDSELTICK